MTTQHLFNTIFLQKKSFAYTKRWCTTGRDSICQGMAERSVCSIFWEKKPSNYSKYKQREVSYMNTLN